MTYTNSGDTTGRCPICGFGFDSKGYLVWRQADGAGNDGEWHRYGDLVACRHNESVIAASLSRHCGLSPTEQMEMLWAEVRAEVEGREEAVKRVVAAWKVGKGLVALEGPPGTGKTRLMMTVVNESRKAGRSAIYITMARLMEHMRQVYDDLRGKQYSALVEKVGQAAVVCIDEIDKARVTEFVKERWFTFLDDRYRMAANALTVVAYNEPDSVPNYIRSRFREHDICRLTNQDLRPMVAEWTRPF